MYAAHIFYGVTGALSTGLAIYGAMTSNPGVAAIFGALAFFSIYPQKPH